MISRRTVRKYMFDVLGYAPNLIDLILSQQVIMNVIGNAQREGLFISEVGDQIEDIRIQNSVNVFDSLSISIAEVSGVV